MSSDDQSDKECPLCMEAFDIDDINFYPCKCQYQICRFCWHRIRTNENGLCPACRQSYPEDPVNFQPLSSADLQKIKCEKKQKVQQQKNRVVESRKHLSEFRVLQKNLVYAVGLSQRMADPELLKKNEFFGKFGKIIKVAVGAAPAINSSQPAVHTAYITYTRSEDALKAIQAVNNMVVEGRFLKASLGTTKYCSNFLKGLTCHKPECMYLHEVAEEEISFTKEDMHQGKHTDYERRLHEQMVLSVGASSNSRSQQPPPPLQQQNSFGTGRELAAMRHRAATTEKKRSGAGGSLENLPTMTSGGAKKGTATSQKQQQQRTRGAKGGTATGTSGGWTEQEKLRGGSETRELLRNSRTEHSKKDTKRTNDDKFGGGKSVSPLPTQSRDKEATKDSKQLQKTESAEENHCHPGEKEDTPMDPSPTTIAFSSTMESNQWIDTDGSSSPIPFSSSVPPQPAVDESILRINGDLCDEIQNQQRKIEVQQQQRLIAAKNYFLDEEHDDELGFDPFAESSKALEEIMEEEKIGQGQLQNGSIIDSHTSSSSHFFSGNNTYFECGSEHPKGLSQHQYTGPPPGLHHPSPFSAYQQHLGSSSHNFSVGGCHNSLSDLRESFKAMLPNVNVRFVSNSANDQQQQQPQQNYCGYFGAGGNISTSSLPAIPSSYHQGNEQRPSNPMGFGATESNHFRSFVPSSAMDQQPQQHPYGYQHFSHQIGGFGGRNMQQKQNGGQQPSFGATVSLMGTDGFSQHQEMPGATQPQHSHLHHHQQQFVFSEHHPQQQQQADHDYQQRSEQGWLPVPPGFSPRTG